MSPSSSAISFAFARVLLDDEHLVVRLDELLGEVEADLAAADDDDVHALSRSIVVI